MFVPIHPETILGAAHLTVSNLDASLRFYQNSLGFALHARNGTQASLGAAKADGMPAGRPFLTLIENPAARPASRATGLYHFAVLVPGRVELAQVLRNIAITQTPVQGFADHGVSEAIYLPDPDNNGIEIYRDRLREEWPRNADGSLAMVTAPIDLDGLLAEVGDDPWAGIPEGTRMGHIHLHVRNIPEAEEFYKGVLGFDLIQRYGPSASFMSAGGYHHHIGLNTWNGVGAPPPPEDSIGLRWFDVQLPNSGALNQAADRIRKAGYTLEECRGGLFVHDPSRNGILLSV